MSFGIFATHLNLTLFSLPTFQLLADCMTVVIAAKLGVAFDIETQAAWQKFVYVVVSALGRQYH